MNVMQKANSRRFAGRSQKRSAQLEKSAVERQLVSVGDASPAQLSELRRY